jgi:WhiB family redox-sensing transcriptional regulator
MAVASELPPQVPGVLDWRAHAACRGADVELFFNPDRERGGRKRRREAKAKAICATCPVVDSCLDWALRVGEPYGVWGGLSAEQRAVRRNGSGGWPLGPGETLYGAPASR